MKTAWTVEADGPATVKLSPAVRRVLDDIASGGSERLAELFPYAVPAEMPATPELAEAVGWAFEWMSDGSTYTTGQIKAVAALYLKLHHLDPSGDAEHLAKARRLAGVTGAVTAAGEPGWSLSEPPTRTWYMYEWDCKVCGHETLKKPVFLAGPDGVISAGTRCAAIVLYGREDAPTQNRVRKDFDALAYKAKQDADMADERKQRYGDALAEFEADRSGAPSKGLQSCRTTYHSRGGKGGTGLDFPTFLRQVSETGIIP